MDKKMAAIPVSLLASLSDGRFMLRAAGEGKNLPYSSHRDDYYLFGVMLSGEQTAAVLSLPFPLSQLSSLRCSSSRRVHS